MVVMLVMCVLYVHVCALSTVTKSNEVLLLIQTAISHSHVNVIVKAHTHLIIVLAGHDIGERNLSLEHFSAVHELHQQVADRLKLHLLCWLYIRQNQARENLD